MNSIIITGANSGIGLECAIHMARIAPEEQIILACRNPESANRALEHVKTTTGHRYLKYLSLDLASLESIREFARQFKKDEHNTISALVNNAGVQNVNDTRYTEDGIEITFGTNHLGHFYLTLLLLPLLDKTGSITFTASNTHDPLMKTGIAPPVYTNASDLAFPKDGRKPKLVQGQIRYSTSKLCNVLTTYILQDKLADTNIRVNAFDPGLTPGTGLAKNYPPIFQFIWRNILPAFILFKKNTNSVSTNGKRLAVLAYSPEYSHLRGVYFSEGKVQESSKDSYYKYLQEELWHASIDLAGIKEEETSISLF